MDIAKRNGLFVVEDAAQALLSTYKARHHGTIGHLGYLSFHETKNIISGEDGALLINDKSLSNRQRLSGKKGQTENSSFVARLINTHG